MYWWQAATLNALSSGALKKWRERELLLGVASGNFTPDTTVK